MAEKNNAAILEKFERYYSFFIEEQNRKNHSWRCDKCGNMIDTEICPFCIKNS